MLDLPGAARALTTFPRNRPSKFFFSALEGARAPSASPGYAYGEQ